MLVKVLFVVKQDLVLVFLTMSKKRFKDKRTAFLWLSPIVRRKHFKIKNKKGYDALYMVRITTATAWW